MITSTAHVTSGSSRYEITFSNDGVIATVKEGESNQVQRGDYWLMSSAGKVVTGTVSPR